MAVDSIFMESLPPSKKSIIRHLYDWVLSWADTPYGTPALFVISFAESSFFPIPPDVLQIALSAAKPRRAFWYATVSLVASVLGALLGYYIGCVLWDTMKGWFIPYVFTQNNFDYVQHQYQTYGYLAVFTAAFTPIPYKIFTIAAGVCELSLVTLIGASIVGRGARFYLVAALMYFCGPTIKHWIEKYFDIVAIAFTALLIAGFVLIKFVF